MDADTFIKWQNEDSIKSTRMALCKEPASAKAQQFPFELHLNPVIFTK